MPLGMEVGLSPRDLTVLDEGPAPPKKGWSLKFSAHVYCGQTAGWIKMPLGREVNLGPGGGVSDGDGVAVHPKKGTAPQFSVHVYYGQKAGWMKTPLGTEVVDLGHIVLDGVPLSTKGAEQPPLFSAHIYCSHHWSFVAHLSYC